MNWKGLIIPGRQKSVAIYIHRSRISIYTHTIHVCFYHFCRVTNPNTFMYYVCNVRLWDGFVMNDTWWGCVVCYWSGRACHNRLTSVAPIGELCCQEIERHLFMMSVFWPRYTSFVCGTVWVCTFCRMNSFLSDSLGARAAPVRSCREIFWRGIESVTWHYTVLRPCCVDTLFGVRMRVAFYGNLVPINTHRKSY